MRSRSIYSSVQAALAFAGTADAGTLYWAHRSGVDLPCTSGDGCDLVNSSHWAFVGPVPVALLGVLAYVVILFASVLKLTSDENRTLDLRVSSLILAVTFFGTCFSWRLQYVATVYIGAFCIYCRMSAIVMTALFLTSLIERIRFNSDSPALSQSTKA